MKIIDQFAYSNALRQYEPSQKAGLACVTVIGCLLMPHPVVGLLALLWMAAITVLWARIPAIVFVRVLLAEGTFLLMSVVSVMISIQMSKPDALFSIFVAGVWISISVDSLTLAVTLFMRALGCATALNFLILTIPLVDIIELLRRMRIPDVLIELMMILYRSIFVLLDSLSRMSTAQDARLGYRNARSSFRSAGLLGSQLFLVAYRRGQRLQVSLESRGLNGSIRVIQGRYVKDNRVLKLGFAIATSMCLGWFFSSWLIFTP
jgi:cobalt/nickel transport system permease protein